MKGQLIEKKNDQSRGTWISGKEHKEPEGV